ncbi:MULTISPECIES: hypothetical protein [Caldimonas]|uniref:hypothetical protein n=1 Tax=Caldimonas TaxID=196013 RepID=UPI0012EAA87A|nr:hypothetical protein [Caldimonas manganoxidans]
MSRPANLSLAQRAGAPWWREPMMWLVLGAPAAVIAACVVTITLAIRHPDPVLQRSAVSAAATRSGAGAASERSWLPAQQARNHSATPASALTGRGE